MVVHPLSAGRKFGRGAFGDEVIVEEELDVVGGPLDGVEMEAGGDGFAGGEWESCCDGVVAVEAGAVDGAVDGCRVADVFDCVDLAALWPWGGVDVFA